MLSLAAFPTPTSSLSEITLCKSPFSSCTANAVIYSIKSSVGFHVHTEDFSVSFHLCLTVVFQEPRTQDKILENQPIFWEGYKYLHQYLSMLSGRSRVRMVLPTFIKWSAIRSESLASSRYSAPTTGIYSSADNRSTLRSAI